jgi:O-antigen ligase
MVFPFVVVGLTRMSETAAGIGLLGQYMLVAGLAFYAFLSRTKPFRFSAITVLLLLFFIWMLLNSVQSSEPLESMILSLIYLLFFPGLLMCGQKVLSDAHNRDVFIKALVVWSLLMTVLQLPFLLSGGGRFKGMFENVVGFMVVGQATTIFLFWAALRKGFDPKSLIIYLPFGLLSTMLLILTAGRTAIGATAAGLLTILARRIGRNVFALLLIVVLAGPLVVSAIMSYEGYGAVKEKLTSERSSGRGDLWHTAWAHIMEKPYLGWGTGMGIVKSLEEGRRTDAHNSYLAIAREQGILMAMLFLLVFAYLPFRGLILMRNVPSEEMKDYLVLSSAYLMSQFVASLVSHDLYSTRGLLLAMTMIGLQEGVLAEYLRSHSPSGRAMRHFGTDREPDSPFGTSAKSPYIHTAKRL